MNYYEIFHPEESSFLFDDGILNEDERLLLFVYNYDTENVNTFYDIIKFRTCKGFLGTKSEIYQLS